MLFRSVSQSRYTERVNAVQESVVNKITNVVQSTANVVNTVAQTYGSGVLAYGQLSSSLNDKQVAADFASGFVSSTQTTTQYANALQATATSQIASAEAVEEARRVAQAAAEEAKLRELFEESVKNGFTGTFEQYSITAPRPQVYLPVLYRVVSNGVRLRAEPSLSGTYKQLTINDGLNLVTEVVNNIPVPKPFVAANGYTFGNFRLLSTGETGWIAINLITPRISLTGTP